VSSWGSGSLVVDSDSGGGRDVTDAERADLVAGRMLRAGDEEVHGGRL